MSEYRYYEFQAIDRLLTPQEMKVLRSYSTRARITPARFVNHYSWGSFKGDVGAWMDKYFDAFLYFANWGTRVLKLRLPTRILDLHTALQYCTDRSVEAWEKEGRTFLSFVTEPEEPPYLEADLELEGTLTTLAVLRLEFARGDFRGLYLAWLLGVQNGEIGREETEPPVPAGLGELTPCQKTLIEFMGIDGDLVHAVSETSVPLKEASPKRPEIQAWIASLPGAQKDELLTRLVIDGDGSLAAELLRRFRKEAAVRPAGPAGAGAPRRTVKELLEAARAYRERRLQMEAERRAREMARLEREAAAARQRYLDSLAGRAPQVWGEIEELIASRQPTRYDRAVELLLDLRDLDARAAGGGDFSRRLGVLREKHGAKSSFLQRLARAGL
jgi:hypothetical protein